MFFDILIFYRSKISKNNKGHQSPLKKKNKLFQILGSVFFDILGLKISKGGGASQPELEIAQNGEIPPKYQSLISNIKLDIRISSLIFWS